jgi:hypothetical protein
MSGDRTFEIRLPEGRIFVRYQGRGNDLRFREHARDILEEMAKRPLGAAAERALDAMETEMLSETHRWPDGAVVIPSDLQEFGVAVADAVAEGAPFVLVFPDGQEVVFRPIPRVADNLDLSTTLDALRKIGPLTYPRVLVDLQAYGVSVAATSALYEPPVAA